AFGVMERHTVQMTSAARKVMPVRTIRIDHGSPPARRISGISTVNVMPPMAAISRPLACWSGEVVNGTAAAGHGAFYSSAGQSKAPGPETLSARPAHRARRLSSALETLPSPWAEMLLRQEAHL